MEALGAAFELHQDSATGVNAIIRRVVAGEYLELRDNVRSGHHVQFSARTAVIHLAAIDEPVIMVRIGAVEADRCVRSPER